MCNSELKEIQETNAYVGIFILLVEKTGAFGRLHNLYTRWSIIGPYYNTSAGGNSEISLESPSLKRNV